MKYVGEILKLKSYILNLFFSDCGSDGFRRMSLATRYYVLLSGIIFKNNLPCLFVVLRVHLR